MAEIDRHPEYTPVSNTRPWSNSLRQISAQMRAESPVFIVGCPRSGSTLLYRILQRHSDFKPREENLSEAEVFHFANSSHLFSGSFPKPAHAYMGNDDLWQQFMRTTAPIRTLHRVSRLPALIRLAERSPSVWRLYGNPAFVRCYFYFARKARGGKRILEKTNYYIRSLPRLKATFPNGHFLLIHRHPVDTYTSYLRRGRVEDRPWLRKSPSDFCRLWRENLRAAADQADEIKAIAYHELTSEPEHVFRDVCAHIASPFEAESLREPNPDMNRLPVDPHLYAPITAKTKNWRDFMSEADAMTIEAELRDVMTHWGYKPYVAAAE